MSKFDELWDRLTAEDREAFAMLKCWSAAPMINNHGEDDARTTALMTGAQHPSLSIRRQVKAHIDVVTDPSNERHGYSLNPTLVY